jgi:hypothetical protein
MAMVCMAQGLKDIAQEGVFTYMLPCKQMVNVRGYLYLTPT